MRDMQIRAVIIASGDVQRVGFRDIVEYIARKMKVVGFVENIKPYDVKIVCEGDKETIDSFVEKLKIKKYPVNVEQLDMIIADATGEFTYFEIKRGDMTEELGERLDTANANMIGMLQKQDLMIETIKDFKYETNENLNRLTNIMTKHDVEAREQIVNLTIEMSGVKDRLTRLECALS
jgi:acylphosphatase